MLLSTPRSRRICVVATLLAFAAGSAQAAICRITPDGSDSTDGSNWATQAKSLQSALSDTNCNELWVRQGIYKPAIGREGADNVDSPFVIRWPLRLHGGFAGDETTLADRHATLPTVLSGDIDSNDLDPEGNGITEDHSQVVGKNSIHVLVIGGTAVGDGNNTYTAENTVLDRIVITAGRAIGTFDRSEGGGVYCNGRGGGNQCSPLFDRVLFAGNMAGRGGAMFNKGVSGGDSSPRITNSTFSGNRAFDNGGDGGAMYNWGDGGRSVPRTFHVTFRGNSAQNSGGAVYIRGSGANTSGTEFRNAILWDNSSSDDDPVYVEGNAYADFTDIIAGPSLFWCPFTGLGGGGCNGALILTDPLLGPLQDNKGATLTHLAPSGSVAINAVACNSVYGSDQRGVSRPQGSQCDIGAVERQSVRVKLASAPLLDAPEGDGASRILSIPLAIDLGDDGALNGPVNLSYSLAPANGSAGVVASDFDGSSSGSLSFPNANAQANAVLAVRADDVVEPAEGFRLNFTPPAANATLDPALAAGLLITLRNDDRADVSVPTLSQSEGSGAMNFAVSLSAPVQGGFAIDYATVADSATAGTDFTATSGTVLHAGNPAAAPGPIVVGIIADSQPEPAESFDLGLAARCDFTPCDIDVVDGRGTIQNDDANLSIAIDNGRSASASGDVVSYQIVVTNNAVQPANGVTVNVPLPTGLTGGTWSCTAPVNGTCTPATGSGAVVVTMNLPPDSSGTIVLSATVGAIESALTVTATVGVPADYADTKASDNVATDVDTGPVVFRNGFEGN